LSGAWNVTCRLSVIITGGKRRL